MSPHRPIVGLTLVVRDVLTGGSLDHPRAWWARATAAEKLFIPELEEL